MSRKHYTEQDARKAARELGNKLMKRGKRQRWNKDDAAAAIAEYRRLTGRPDATLEATKTALDALTGNS